MVGRWVSFWDSLFSGAMLNFGGVYIGVSPTCLLNSWTFWPAIRLFYLMVSTLRSPCLGSSDAVNGPWTNQDGKMSEFWSQRWCHWSDMLSFDIKYNILIYGMYMIPDQWWQMIYDVYWCMIFDMITVKRFLNEMWYYYISYDITLKKTN